MKKLIFTGIVVLSLVFPDAYAQWQQTGGAVDTSITQLVVLNSYLFAGTSTEYNNSQIIASTNNGTSWYFAKTGLARRMDAFAPSGTNLFLSLDDAGVYISTDYGITWTQTSPTVEPYTFSFATMGPKLFAGTWYQGVYVTTDNGTTWTQMNSGLTTLNVNVLLVKGSNLFAGTSGGGVYLSTNEGISWTSVSSGIPAYYGYIDAMHAIGNNVFAGTYNKGIYLSTNDGSNWTAVNNGLPMFYSSYYQVKTFASSGNNLFVGMDGGGVYLSTNNGSSWTDVNQGLTHLSIYALAIKDGYLFAGGDSGGVWRRPLSEMTAVNDGVNNLPGEFSLSQNYPNPFNPNTTIEYRIPDREYVKLKIYDVLGTEIATLVNEEKSGGNYSVKFDGSNLSSGIYFYQLRAGVYNSTKKLVLMK